MMDRMGLQVTGVLLAVILLCFLNERGALSTPAIAQERGCAERIAAFPNPDMLRAMQRGVNLPGWDREAVAGAGTLRPLEALRARGFTHVRLPIDNRPLDGPEAKAYLDRLFEQVVFLLSLDFSVSLDLHPDGHVRDLFAKDPAEAEAYLAATWRRIAVQARSFDPKRVAVELLNEPAAEPAAWDPVAASLAQTIRKLLPETTIVIGPAGPQRHETLADMTALSDPNVVYAVHYYDPFAFTHQGADWNDEGDPLAVLKGLPFPATLSDPAIVKALADLNADGRADAARTLELSLDAPWDAGMVEAAFDTMAAWSAKSGRPVIVNEFGALSWRAPRESRLAWLKTVREAAETRCIGWTHWDFQDGFGLIDEKTGLPDAGVLDALAPATPSE